MATFSEAHAGDLIKLRQVSQWIARLDKAWALPMRLASDPAPCGDPGCEALACEALTADGRTVPLHRLGSRLIDVLEAAHGGDDLAENAGEPELPLWIEDEYRRGKDT